MAGSLQHDKIHFVRYGGVREAGANLMTKAQEKQIDDLKGRLCDAMDAIALLKSDLKAAREVSQLRDETATRNAELHEQNAQLLAENRALKSANSDAASSNANLASLRAAGARELSEANAEIERLSAALKKNAEKTSERLSAANEEIDRLKAVIGRQVSPLSNTERGEMARLKAELDLIRREQVAK